MTGGFIVSCKSCFFNRTFLSSSKCIHQQSRMQSRDMVCAVRTQNHHFLYGSLQLVSLSLLCRANNLVWHCNLWHKSILEIPPWWYGQKQLFQECTSYVACGYSRGLYVLGFHIISIEYIFLTVAEYSCVDLHLLLGCWEMHPILILAYKAHTHTMTFNFHLEMVPRIYVFITGHPYMDIGHWCDNSSSSEKSSLQKKSPIGFCTITILKVA